MPFLIQRHFGFESRNSFCLIVSFLIIYISCYFSFSFSFAKFCFPSLYTFKMFNVTIRLVISRHVLQICYDKIAKQKLKNVEKARRNCERCLKADGTKNNNKIQRPNGTRTFVWKSIRLIELETQRRINKRLKYI